MKKETLLESLNYIDEDLLAASEKPLKSYRPKVWAKWLAAAAVLVLVLGVANLVVKIAPALAPAKDVAPAALPESFDAPTPLAPEMESIYEGYIGTEAPAEEPAPEPEERELPILEAGDSFHESALVHSLDALDALPVHLWTEESDFATLPVFETREQTYDSTAPILDDEAMQQFLREEAEKFGFREIEIRPAVYNLPNNAELPADAASYVAQSGDQMISITSSGRIVLYAGTENTHLFIEPIDRVSEEVHRTKLREDRRYAEEYYVNILFDILELPYREAWELNIENSQASNDPRYASGRATTHEKELYLAEMLRNVELVLNDDGSLQSLAYDACFREKYLPLGDYPIILYETAVQLAKNGQYFTDGLLWEGWRFDWDANNGLLHGELIYNEIAPDRLRMPYYRFYVEVLCTPEDRTLTGPDAQAQTVYLPIYVPAICDEYLSDFPLEW